MKQEHHKKNLIAWAFIIGYLFYPVIIILASTQITDMGIDIKELIKDFFSGLNQIIILVVYAYFREQKDINEINNKQINKPVRKNSTNKVVRKKKIT